ncbi:hypothetical protein ACFLX4_03480, partial [Chloroflexota bacterium]
MVTYRYSKLDRGQDSFDLDTDELMDELGCNLMSTGSPSDALSQMQRSGVRDSQGRQLPGLQELLQRLGKERQSLLGEHELRSKLEEIRRKLDEMLNTELAGIQKGLDGARQGAGEGTGQSSQEMQQRSSKTNDGMTAQDLAQLEKLAKSLQNQIVQAQSSLGSLSPEERALLENMLQSALCEYTQR